MPRLVEIIHVTIDLKFKSINFSFMKSHEISDDDINRTLQLDDGENDTSVYHMDTIDFQQRYPEHCVVNNWYYPLYSR